MKILSLTLLFFAFPSARAAEILGGQVTAPHSFELKIRYTGGGKSHEFKLENGACSASMPGSCDLRLVDTTKDDLGQQVIETTITLQNDLIGARSISRIYITGDAKSEFIIDQRQPIGVRE